MSDTMKCITKADIAKELNLSPQYAWRMIHCNVELFLSLSAAGYVKTQKVVTQPQAQIIKEYYSTKDHRG